MNDLFNWSTHKDRTRANQILDAFEKFHRSNPEVWKLFQQFAFEVTNMGRKYYSSNAIFERIRWHVDIETSGPEVKLNNNFRAYYARMFHLAHPHYDGFFRNRKLPSDDVQASKTDVQVFGRGPPGEEESINAKLSEILKSS